MCMPSQKAKCLDTKLMIYLNHKMAKKDAFWMVWKFWVAPLFENLLPSLRKSIYPPLLVPHFQHLYSFLYLCRHAAVRWEIKALFKLCIIWWIVQYHNFTDDAWKGSYEEADCSNSSFFGMGGIRKIVLDLLWGRKKLGVVLQWQNLVVF